MGMSFSRTDNARVRWEGKVRAEHRFLRPRIEIEYPVGHFRILFAMTAVVFSYVACSLQAGDPSVGAAKGAIIYEKAERHFQRVAFYKPGKSAADHPENLAPFFIVERPAVDRAVKPGIPIAGFSCAPCTCRLAPTEPTVFFGTEPIEIGKMSFDSLIFAWFSERNEDEGRVVRLSALRIVLGHDDFPIVYRVEIKERGNQGGKTEDDWFFVTTTFEEQARDIFGAPLEGRRFSVERSLEQADNVAVPNVLEVGPIPMGPYVYLDHGGAVTTLRCRCSASQFDEVVETLPYKLAPIEHLKVHNAVDSGEGRTFPADLPDTAEVAGRAFTRALRWPFDPPKEEKPDENR